MEKYIKSMLIAFTIPLLLAISCQKGDEIRKNNTDIIEFADAVMKELCVDAFDTNGDGELSYDEAVAVTDLNMLKLTKKNFKTFDEFQYFTSVKHIPNCYFMEVGIESIKLPESIISIGGEAFHDCSNLTNVTIPEGVTSIGYCAFEDCYSLTNVTIPESVTSIGNKAFEGCHSLESVTIPEGVTSLASHIFYSCTGLESVTIHESVTSIGDGAFRNCSRLTNVTIPESVIIIGMSAFEGCKSLVSVRLNHFVPPVIHYSTFGSNGLNRTFYVPAEAVETYRSANGWSKYASSIVGYYYIK